MIIKKGKGSNNMALINCPECNGTVSDCAILCPHCGYPISKARLEFKQELVDLVINSISDNQDYKIKTIKIIREIKGMSLSEAVQFTKAIPSVILCGINMSDAQKIQKVFLKLGCKTSIEKAKMTGEEDSEIAEEYANNIGKIVCPRCKSTAITTGTKGYGLIRGFLGSNKTVNRCGSCGYSWEP